MNPAEIVIERMRPLLPEVSGVAAKLPPLDTIRAVIFDVYGTLIISAAGDISLVEDRDSETGMKRALELLGKPASEAAISSALAVYRSEIARLQELRRGDGVEFPEVEIREVWTKIAGGSGVSEATLERAALEYECAVNPCWEMPGAGAVIDALSKSGRRLGIISNAQFYTRAVVAGVLGIDLRGPAFEASLSVFSYEEREGKPSRFLFEKAATGAAEIGISPAEVLYVGNDFIKDIQPAGETGFRTALFAGDARSFRTGGFSVEEACRSADVVLTELVQLADVLRLTS